MASGPAAVGVPHPDKGFPILTLGLLVALPSGGIDVIREDPRGCVLTVWLQPRASRNEVAGVHGEALRIRLTAPPVAGRANKALGSFLGELFAVPPGAVEILSGHHGRRKAVLIRGLAPQEAEARLKLTDR